MNDQPSGSAQTDIEVSAARLLKALDAYIVNDSGEARAAERYGERVRFAMARVEELRRSAQQIGGAFEPARLEVSLSILDSNVRQAGMFTDRIIARMPKQAASAYRQRPAIDAIEEPAMSLIDERAA